MVSLDCLRRKGKLTISIYYFFYIIYLFKKFFLIIIIKIYIIKLILNETFLFGFRTKLASFDFN